ncbi:helix-turn-helix domain-containing protein [Virgibacillus oceani]|uniref:HTH-type transcriptional regulator YtdP n=1 Tax=Virgibacillus oceani TaxID=1479511 RepID=A0A917M1G7_9BACI|nr:AraC family transcriptional regulator [Virgibacillus oceani]GGG73111.1 putative HTH-type transcriptional regulator YtdP [Virgibacillus oceani]
MKELKNLATRISFDHRLTPYMFTQPYSSKLAIEQLGSYKVNSSIINGLYLYYQGENQIYSPRGTSSVDTFLNTAYRIKESEMNKLKEKMEAITKPEVFPIELLSKNNRRNHIITYMYPIPMNNTLSYGSVAFFVKESAFKKMTQNVLSDFKGNMYIFNEKSELLASNSNGEKLELEEVRKLARGETGVFNKTIDKENYSFVTVRSDSSKWTFLTAMPTAQFYGRMSSLKLTIIIILSIIAIVGILTTIYMSFQQYKPIKSIALALKSKQSEQMPKRINKNELESIRESIELIHEDSEQLQKKMKAHRPFIKDQLLLLLLKGDIKKQTEINDLLVDLKIDFNGDRFFISLISFKDRIEEHESLQSREKILSLLAKMTYKDCVGYGVELIHDNAAALIVSMKDNSKDPIVAQQNFVENLKQQLRQYSKVMPTIGIGKVYEGIGWINRSFIEANASIEYDLLNKDNTIYFENMTPSNEGLFWYPIDDQAKFIQSVKQGDAVVARETLNTIFSNLKEQNASTYMLRCMCFDIINTILKNTLELGINLGTVQVKRLTEFKSLEDLEHTLNILLTDICEEVEERKESHNSMLRDNILEYIHGQYKSHELGLEHTAEKFQLSASYLSRFMKEQTGKTFTQFVWQLRNEEFKRQLTETGKPIKEIVLDIGYVDVANFTRKFKKEEGVTPGQYRKNNRNSA